MKWVQGKAVKEQMWALVKVKVKVKMKGQGKVGRKRLTSDEHNLLRRH